jgi:peptidoglycan/LPS O-acetylase OafA/YrhL
MAACGARGGCVFPHQGGSTFKVSAIFRQLAGVIELAVGGFMSDSRDDLEHGGARLGNTEPRTGRTGGFLIELQSLRGLAACVVLMGHATQMYDQPQAIYASLFFNGRGAVVLFFVLSGFVLTRSLRNDSFTSESIARFYVRRLMRLYPAIWIASTLSLVYLFTVHPLVPVPDASAIFLSRYRPDRMNMIYIGASYLGLFPFLIPQLWTITIEVTASMAIPFMAYAAYHRAKLFCGFGLGALIVNLMGPWPLCGFRFYGTLYGVAFFAGAWLAKNTKWQKLFFGGFGKFSTGIAAVLGLLFPLTPFLPFSYWSPAAALLETGLSLCLIGLIVYSGGDFRILRSRALVFFGNISYSLYLIHYFVASLLLKIFTVSRTTEILGLSGVAKPILLTATTFVVTIPLSWLLYSLVEVPGIRAGRRISAAASRRHAVI